MMCIIVKMIILMLTFVLAVCDLTSNNSYQYHPDVDGWLKLHKNPASWDDAHLICLDEGATLASPFGYMRRKIEEIIRNVYGKIGTVYTAIPPVVKSETDSEVTAATDVYCQTFNYRGELEDVTCQNPHPFLCYMNEKADFFRSCGTPYDGYTLDEKTGSCYKFHRVVQDWPRANETCIAEGGHLCIINSEVEADVIRDLFSKNPPSAISGDGFKEVAIVGFYDWNKSGEWRTVQGETLSQAGYSKFKPGEPTGYSEYCGNVFRSGLLNDVTCDYKSAFICEKGPDSL